MNDINTFVTLSYNAISVLKGLSVFVFFCVSHRFATERERHKFLICNIPYFPHCIDRLSHLKCVHNIADVVRQ